ARAAPYRSSSGTAQYACVSARLRPGQIIAMATTPMTAAARPAAWMILRGVGSQYPPGSGRECDGHPRAAAGAAVPHRDEPAVRRAAAHPLDPGQRDLRRLLPDRKSTRLNSSHDQISYAVFCLK